MAAAAVPSPAESYGFTRFNLGFEVIERNINMIAIISI